ncbi:MAG TPA: hypothetical protein VNA27_07595 [Rubrobacteraceae bacterium]|nr:hypothetical protein [Rubrobacteraceae bacterium]
MTSEVCRGTIAVRIGEREGSFIPQRKFIHLELRSVNIRPESSSANSEEADWGYDEANGKITVRLAESSGAIAVELGF